MPSKLPITKGSYWPKAEITDAEIQARFSSAFRSIAELNQVLISGEICSAFGQKRNVSRLFEWRYAVQSQGLAAGVRSDGDARLNGCGLQVVQAGVRFEVQVRMDRIGDQQATSFQYPHDAAALIIFR